MATVTKLSLHDWVLDRIGTHRFGKDNPGRKITDVSMRKNGNLNLVVDEDVELVVNAGRTGLEPEVLLVPKGSRVTVFRHPKSAAPTDTVATVFAERFQASLKGNRRTFVKQYPRPSLPVK